jgi:hypothetical protein
MSSPKYTSYKNTSKYGISEAELALALNPTVNTGNPSPIRF